MEDHGKVVAFILDQIKKIDKNSMEDKKFRVLSLDGGGIRGLFSATILAEIERDLKKENVINWQIYKNVDLIFGTSTGGILGLALSLAIPAEEIKTLYFQNASEIFGSKSNILKTAKKFCNSFFRASHKRYNLERLVKEVYSKSHNGNQPLLKDCKVPVAVSIYNLDNGSPSVLKSSYHERFTRDPNLPVFKAALATSAAPTYFDPYSSVPYLDSKGDEVPFEYKVDGGVWANNPSLIALIEAQKAFKKELSEISLLSIGTGKSVFIEKKRKKGFGLFYWALTMNKRIIELFMQGQSQQVENVISLLKNGIDKEEPDNFDYLRLNVTFEEEFKSIEMDETDVSKLLKLEEKALEIYKENKTEIYRILGLINLR